MGLKTYVGLEDNNYYRKCDYCRLKYNEDQLASEENGKFICIECNNEKYSYLFD